MSTPTHGAALRGRLARVGGAAAALALGLSLAPALLPTAQAAAVTPGELQINEVYGGGGNSGASYQSDFVELVNTSDADLSIDGWSLQYASKTGTFNNTVDLTGTVPAGGTFLIQLASGNGNGEPLPAADLTGGINASGSGGVFALSDAQGNLACHGTTCAEDPAVVDLVGWGGAETFSGDAPAPATTNATSVSRIAATGENSTDFEAGHPTPTLSGAEPGDGGDDGGDGEPPAEATEVSIAQIQGTGATSPLAGQDVITEGVVTAVYATGGLNGYVIQTAGTGGALDFSTHEGSTAVFVYSPDTASEVALGDSVRVTGEVSEYYDSTQISVRSGGLELLEQPLGTVEPATLEGVFPTEEAQRESLEHMLYLPGEGDFTVTDVYNTARYGEVTLAIGDEPLQQAGDIMRPGEEASAYFDSRDQYKVLLDDGRTTNFSSSPEEPMSWLTTEEPVRVGAQTTFTEPVVVAYSFDQWRLNTTTPWSSASTDGVDFENTRQDAPDEVGGDLTLSTFNVLNYFTTLGEDTPGCEPYTNMHGEPTNVRGGCDLRGAWGEDDLERQESKIVDAISGTGADVVGLTEIENSARIDGDPDEATATLVAALNEKDGEGTWAYVPTDPAYQALGLEGGQDAITNAIIYQPAEVAPVGEAQILAGDEAFENAREPIGQQFVPVEGSGEEQVEGEPFFFTINHFKSKGSQDAEDSGLEADPVQGNARTSRLQQAEALLAWGETTAAELGVEDVFHGGDFNAYTQEEPLQLFYEQGFVNLAETHDPEGWSYSYGGMVGSLDHVLASPSAAERVSGATDWQINGPEPVMAQYSRYQNNATDLYESGPFASSDHDPIIVGLESGITGGGDDGGEGGHTPGDGPRENDNRGPGKNNGTPGGSNSGIGHGAGGKGRGHNG
ncbi:ExeM/NucH family extracellular endonuclease [Brachybacterium saurashtrense]|uniref:Glutamate--cysteine ligase n=1 Tax=Brachybacterium saurashtrense TaxID=556288 RepID=A0A345YQH4_9MICO|nr:ExeM/NucH family extracellular endonuclease [Brachybacterium saurashtrense]AXK46176.1 glutamate--cysteine ligase [Brachybacterium saurashtrense]RRR23916.1 glutamate--cysteine ligase [Brachybacterium saurashtrense]